MERYCGSTFWDTHKTWNTTDPDFTECFENTALLWSACAFLWIGSVFDVYIQGSRRISAVHDAPNWLPGWTWLGVFKVFNITVLICLEVVILMVNWEQHAKDDGDVNIFSIPDMYWTTPLILIVTHFLSASLIVFHKTRCIHTSGMQLLHWLGLSFVHGVMFRTKYRAYKDDPGDGLPALILLGINLSVILLQTFLFCWSDIPESKPDGHTRLIECEDGAKREECPILRSSCLNYVLFSWSTPLIRKGYKAPLTKDDLWDLIPSVKSKIVSKLFYRYYGKPAFGEIRSIHRNIIKPLWKTCGWSFLLAVTCRLVSSIIAFLPPKIMGCLIDFVEDDSTEEWKGYFWASLMFCSYIVMTLFMEQFYLHMFKCYMNIGTCLNLAIYNKSLRVSHEARKDKTAGEIVNLMSVDTEKIRTLIYEADAIWATPIQLSIGILLLWMELGVAILPGIGVLCSIIPINWALTAVTTKYQREQMTMKDERIKIISEVLNGIQVIKLYAWEPSFQSQIQKIRAEEIRILKKRTFIQCVMQFVFDSVPFLVSVAAFFTYVYMRGGTLDPKKAFTAVSLFTLLTDPITELPSCISAAVDASVSFKRINDFLNAEEINPKAIKVEPEHGGQNGNLPAIDIFNGNFAWEDLSTANWQLSDINLELKTGHMTAIVGSVASGKSSLLSAILGEMKYTGDVIVRGKIAYAPQIAWILNGTLRENICFGLPYVKKKYEKVIDACCLISDIEMLPAGDMTEIGEKGINLSGGQKQRVSLARLAYSGADVLLLDDVLSAVDSHVAKHIFDRLLGSKGLLAGKTRILCTHAYNFLSQVDQIVVMDEGRIVETGSYNHLMKSGGNFSHLLANLEQTSKDGNDDDEEGRKKPSDLKPTSDEAKKESGKLIEEEHLETGDVKLSVYLAYIRAMGYPLAVCLVSFFCLSEGLAIGRNVVLSKWAGSRNSNGTRAPSTKEDLDRRGSYAIQYAMLGIAQSLFYLLGFILLAVASLSATRLLHNNMLKRILRAPMSFFNVTLLGRIVNRFSSDVESVDRSLPSQIGDWICHIFKFAGILITISYTNVYFTIFIVPMFIVYYILQRYYIVCMQQLQRIVNANKSPIYAQFQETLAGTSTVRAYQAQDRFSDILGNKIDSYVRAFFPHQIVRRWLSIRLGFVGSVVVFIPSVFAVIWRNTTDSSMVGLSIAYALQVIGVLNWLIKVTSYLQYNFVSVERILEYTDVAQEAPLEAHHHHRPSTTSCISGVLGQEVTSIGPTLMVSPAWPEKGGIEFIDYETRYRPGLNPVLKHFSCKINPGEKIGVVGRTGAGKSSLTLALFRIIESVHGEIDIDGVNIAEIGLHDLRKKLTVIPQDPVLFSRSLRLNLDPFEMYDDKKLWEALRLAHLSQFVEDQPEGLDYPIAEGGENLSVGQRQLVCLARAILRKSSILILDEATASVDSATDELIQLTIREHFVGCTILNVAHRLKTVLDSSRILVLHRGEIVEFDTPEVLLANPNSHFYGMAKDAGII